MTQCDSRQVSAWKMSQTNEKTSHIYTHICSGMASYTSGDLVCVNSLIVIFSFKYMQGFVAAERRNVL